MHPADRARHRAAAVAFLLATAGTAAGAQEPKPPTPAAPSASAPRNAEPQTQMLAPVDVLGHYDLAVGSTDAASAGVVQQGLIARRPTLRPAEVLEFVPGVIVTQHSGGGKANQYFLRGFNLDHGTDFATYVDGMPFNMPTHAHGHGYTDLNGLIPELVSRIAYRKGPYYAEEGDFASAGSARLDLVDRLPRGLASVTLGQDRHARALLANSAALGRGELLYALEASHQDGPWIEPDRLRRWNGVLRWSRGDAGNRVSVTAMGYSARWNATDQIPERAVEAGLVDRYGSLAPTDGGRTERYSLSARGLRTFSDGELRFDAWMLRSRLDLWSDFTYFLENPSDLDPSAIDGDQFQQSERRTALGASLARAWNLRLGGFDTGNTAGLQLRHDRLDPVGLFATVERERVAVTQESRVRETSIGAWLENQTQWRPWFRSVAGVRVDHFRFDVASSIEANSGSRNATLYSPKLSLVFGPWAKTEFCVTGGLGFHSNDARGTVARVAAKSGDPVDPVTPLARSKGAELGLRSEIVPGLSSSLALWQLDLASELLFVGDAGETEASRPSRRRGIELNNHWRPMPWLYVDADLAFSRSRFRDADPAGDRVPGAVATVASLGVSVVDLGRWSGQLQWRYFGPRPLVEDDSRRQTKTFCL